jgi:hypothetical protein
MDEMKERQYICPNCFAQRHWNDVHFRRNVLRQVPDLRQSQLYHCAHPQEALPSDSYALADWRSYPQGQRMVSEGAIVGLTDYNGDTLTTRVCPSCHYPLYQLDGKNVTLLPWQRDQIAFDKATQLLEALGEGGEGWELARQTPDPYHRALTYLQVRGPGGGVLQYPEGLWDADQKRLSGLIRSYHQRSNGGLVWIRLEHTQDYDPEHPELRLDLDGIWALERYAEAIGAPNFSTQRPTVYFMVVSAPMARDEELLHRCLKEEHVALLNGIQVLTPNHLILPWIKGDGPLARRAAEWMLTQMGLFQRLPKIPVIQETAQPVPAEEEPPVPVEEPTSTQEDTEPEPEPEGEESSPE